MSWFFSLIIGGVVGWLASLIMKTNPQMGLLANGGLDGKEAKVSSSKVFIIFPYAEAVQC